MAISRGQQPRQMYQEGGIMPRLNQLGSGVSSAEQTLQEINQRLESAESNLGSGGGQATFELAGGNTTTQPPLNLASDIYTATGLTPRPGTLSNLNAFRDPITGGGQPFFGNANMPSQLEPALSPMSASMRNMAADGGMMGRQMYGLGSLVKKAVKGVTGAVKGIGKTIKENPLLAAAAFNFAPMLLPGGKPFLGLGSLKGSMGTIPGLTSLFSSADKTKKGADLLSTAKVFAGGSLLGGLLNQAEEEGDPEGITRDVGALRSKLINAYKNQRTFADAADEDAAILEQVNIDLSEYNQDMNRTNVAYGGRMGFARGPDNPEQNAIQAAGIMNLPLNQNPAGVTELDLRETGGFIPPVGVKEKADDIPAMLANNEFVFTADAVRGMGEGDVNKGAQRMYDMMKKLEKGGRV